MKITKIIVISFLIYQNGFSQSLREEIYSNPRTVFERLNEAYGSGDLQPFDSFFQSWHELTLERESLDKDRFLAFVDSIFLMVYFPFDYKQYGWKARRNHKDYRYAILQTTIPYCLKDSVYSNSLDSLVSCSYNSQTRHFYSSIELYKKKIIYDDIYYGSVLKMFLESDDIAKRNFIGKWIKETSPNRQLDYLTSPTIIGLQINRNRTNVIVHIRLERTEFYISLIKKNGTWTKEILPYQLIHD